MADDGYDDFGQKKKVKYFFIVIVSFCTIPIIVLALESTCLEGRKGSCCIGQAAEQLPV